MGKDVLELKRIESGDQVYESAPVANKLYVLPGQTLSLEFTVKFPLKLHCDLMNPNEPERRINDMEKNFNKTHVK